MLIIGEHVCLTLSLAQMVEADNGNFGQTQELGRFKSPVTGKNLIFAID
jgi:hypothetical protein